ncbi:8-oxo-dGTP pyrophosphatase MutT (NUDIX family) [Rhizobium leguminosarum]|uniref:8-oxo-dGTP pyrophosphatase MutT (NUDIX family) n=1 Tax=Rhizobium leguminosarum TaxID=384 RepID=A0AAE2SX76_RHILE|nr:MULTISPECIES: NUDIX domain-containing protein [Rhizobium]MBB4291492.1 8-oxo-dGTP pyrophosphatase MutT (NUDIX family) [Rhizobium leguminosarum]MBB4296189.1 8-oxo-dGTP pyrophosphatase MutT (NUDIX family) [Rhizobium leguminosarum]MBB4308552.1 8-oxo-dGTP pyrophosphatase MutT (NUDIX family) [Rhizobium leguminosarum]MBB4416387.1 8-oxo-dGTP pyrophosphatase MutT (NUDIX family) [Rhizobium leguminosarum]MBB4430646.1 8-oxo-dGTP pyrophosphatase MutT (NUDIX family) [Rhizobium esperanzae]
MPNIDQIAHPPRTSPLTVPQAGVICLIEGSVVLVRCTRTGRWGLPKGTIEQGEGSRETAARESFEEAGVMGAISETPIGHFSYEKEGIHKRYQVAVHLIEDGQLGNDYPEKEIRERGTFNLRDAIAVVAQPEVREMLSALRHESSCPGESRPSLQFADVAAR